MSAMTKAAPAVGGARQEIASTEARFVQGRQDPIADFGLFFAFRKDEGVEGLVHASHWEATADLGSKRCGVVTRKYSRTSLRPSRSTRRQSPCRADRSGYFKFPRSADRQ